MPDVPAGAGAIRGEVVNADEPTRVGDVEILLYALPSSGTPGLRRGRSDATGHFAFEGISNDASTAYLVGARYAEHPLPRRTPLVRGGRDREERHGAGRRSHRGRRAASASSSRDSRSPTRADALGVSELHRLENHGAKTVFVAGPRRNTAKPLFRARLPEGADDFGIPLGIQPEGLVRDGADLRFFGPLYPSSWPGPLAKDQGLAFQYTLPAAAGPFSVEKVFPSGSQRVVVQVANKGPKIRIAGAREEQPDAQPARTTSPPSASWSTASHPAARSRSTSRCPRRASIPDAVHLEEIAGLPRTRRRGAERAAGVPPDGYRRACPCRAGARRRAADAAGPAGAQEVRFDRDAFALGLAPDDGTGAVLRGPLPPGETKIQIAYQLPVTDPSGAVSLDLRVGRTLPLLSIYAADTGLQTPSRIGCTAGVR